VGSTRPIYYRLKRRGNAARLASAGPCQPVAEVLIAENRGGTGRPRFRRFDVGSIRLNGDSLNVWPTADIKELLAQAVRMAVEIQPVHLEEMQLLAS